MNYPVNQDNAERYYAILLEFLHSVGECQHLEKWIDNVKENVYPAKDIALRYYPAGVISMEIQLAEKEWYMWESLNRYSEVSRSVGFLPIDQHGKDLIVKFVADAGRRRYVRDGARRAQQRGEIIHIADLMRRRYALERKRKEKLQQQ